MRAKKINFDRLIIHDAFIADNLCVESRAKLFFKSRIGKNDVYAYTVVEVVANSF